MRYQPSLLTKVMGLISRMGLSLAVKRRKYAIIKDVAVGAAEPIANPYHRAAVFPTESSLSVMSRTSSKLTHLWQYHQHCQKLTIGIYSHSGSYEREHTNSSHRNPIHSRRSKRSITVAPVLVQVPLSTSYSDIPCVPLKQDLQY